MNKITIEKVLARFKTKTQRTIQKLKADLIGIQIPTEKIVL